VKVGVYRERLFTSHFPAILRVCCPGGPGKLWWAKMLWDAVLDANCLPDAGVAFKDVLSGSEKAPGCSGLTLPDLTLNIKRLFLRPGLGL